MKTLQRTILDENEFNVMLFRTLFHFQMELETFNDEDNFYEVELGVLINRIDLLRNQVLNDN